MSNDNNAKETPQTKSYTEALNEAYNHAIKHAADMVESRGKAYIGFPQAISTLPEVVGILKRLANDIRELGQK